MSMGAQKSTEGANEPASLIKVSQSGKKNASNVSVGMHAENSPLRVKGTHLMKNNQSVTKIYVWRMATNVSDIRLK